MNANQEIREELEALGSPLAGLGRSMPYAVPEGYFRALPPVITQGVVYSRKDDPEPGLPKEDPYTIPDGYFAALPGVLLQAASTAEKPAGAGAKAINFRPRWSKRVVKLAAAAVVVLGIGVATFQYGSKPPAPGASAAAQLAALGPEDVEAYVEQHVDEFDTESLESSLIAAGPDAGPMVPELDKQEIQQYLSEEGSIETQTLN